MGFLANYFRKRDIRRWERDRFLFEYYDGKQVRRGDPFRLQRELQNHPKMNLIDMAPFVDQGREPETSICLEATAEIFGVKRWDGESGLTDWEILGLLGELSGYLNALKKNTSPGPILSQPTASAS
ncbi:hypothetical protein [Trichococcus shcherbakoviae]|uniref:hypothetical protein n=1 Tax=Trichococcus shcherbakoviae TaxID=2094020 RepID=UPI002AA79E39|nr:hypothetical protein [Trichococcus shcherbakoviae]